MGDPTVYTDPCAPGAPQVGDVVVVAVDGSPDDSNPKERFEQTRVGRIGVLQYTRPGMYAWVVLAPPCFVHAVRRPTEAELAQWALEDGRG